MAHVHAALMLQYAKDAMETDEPWVLWEFSENGVWMCCTDHPKWAWSTEYRKIDPLAELKEAYNQGKDIINFNPATGEIHGTFNKVTSDWLTFAATADCYRIGNDPYKEFREATANGKVVQWRNGKEWLDLPITFTWDCGDCNKLISPERYRVKPITKKVKLLAWFTGHSLVYYSDDTDILVESWMRAPSEDKEIEVVLTT